MEKEIYQSIESPNIFEPPKDSENHIIHHVSEKTASNNENVDSSNLLSNSSSQIPRMTEDKEKNSTRSSERIRNKKMKQLIGQPGGNISGWEVVEGVTLTAKTQNKKQRNEDNPQVLVGKNNTTSKYFKNKATGMKKKGEKIEKITMINTGTPAESSIVTSSTDRPRSIDTEKKTSNCIDSTSIRQKRVADNFEYREMSNNRGKVNKKTTSEKENPPIANETERNENVNREISCARVSITTPHIIPEKTGTNKITEEKKMVETERRLLNLECFSLFVTCTICFSKFYNVVRLMNHLKYHNFLSCCCPLCEKELENYHKLIGFESFIMQNK